MKNEYYHLISLVPLSTACGENEVWSTQVSNCSMVSCSDLSNAAAFQLNSSCSSPSQDEETCICEPGYYRNHDNECVLPSSCQCVDDEGVMRGAGEVWQKGQCETCLCENGAVVCKTECEPVECEEVGSHSQRIWGIQPWQ